MGSRAAGAKGGRCSMRQVQQVPCYMHVHMPMLRSASGVHRCGSEGHAHCNALVAIPHATPSNPTHPLLSHTANRLHMWTSDAAPTHPIQSLALPRSITRSATTCSGVKWASMRQKSPLPALPRWLPGRRQTGGT